MYLQIAKKTMCKECISHKENKNNLESYFREILPDYDEDKSIYF